MLRSRPIGKQSGESVDSGRRKGKLRWEGFAERKVLQSARSIRLESITASGQGWSTTGGLVGKQYRNVYDLVQVDSSASEAWAGHHGEAHLAAEQNTGLIIAT